MNASVRLEKESNRFGHFYRGVTSEGYGVCLKCGCRENTDDAARGCSDIAGKIAGDIFGSSGTKASRMAFRVGPWAQGEVDLGLGLCEKAMARVIAESISVHMHNYKIDD